MDPMAGQTSYADAGGLRLAYETFGEPSAPPILMVMGLGTQMIAWPDEVCETLAERGYYVVRFDNRDTGLSTHLHSLPAPRPAQVMLRRCRPPYTIDDMADDTVALMDALDLPSVHLVGASMGGFIAQTVAIRHPQRVRSLTLMMTSTGSRWVGFPKPRLVAALARRRRATDRAAAVEAVLTTFDLIGSRGFGMDEAYLRDLAGRSYDRAYDPHGYLRQLAAVIGQRNRTRDLRRIRMPTVVIHGSADPLVQPSGGRALARAIPGARLVRFAGMGHDLPRPLWPQFVEEILRVARQADSRPAGVPG